MSNRFYVNEVQIFGNNEMFENTSKELERQGGKWIEKDWILEKTEITDPQSLMEAVTKDSLNQLKKQLIKQKKFEDLDDSDLLLETGSNKAFLYACYNKDGTPNLLAFWRIEWLMDRLSLFIPFNLWLAIKDYVDMDYNTMRMTLKKDKKIIAEMY